MGSDSSSSRGGASPTPPPSNNKTNKVTKTNESGAPQKITKRRAARACVSCRARKVRCDVVEGAPCGNCRWDNVECIVQESRRRKKHLVTANAVGPSTPTEAPIQSKANTTMNAANNNRGSPSGNAIVNANSSLTDPRRASSGSVLSTATTTSSTDGLAALMPNCMVDSSHVPHMIYQRSGFRRDSALLGQPGAATPELNTANLNANAATATNSSNTTNTGVPWVDSTVNPTRLFGDSRTVQFLNSLDDHDASAQLPPFIRPLPSKIASDDVSYLQTKGALTLPSVALQNALLQAHVEFVHPYMPLMDIHPFLSIVHNRDGFNGQTSLLLYHAIMFSGVAFVDMKHLREAGYSTRKAARKAFFQKTRLLYDFDYESDRLILVQALLLMTYWYETPDDQKDTWHWMGVAISLAHTIGLHRNPGATGMPPAKQKLWKRIWWSCFMRDRLIALGMRRPTRIKDEDFDVPMLVEADFEIQTLPETNTTIPPECTVMRDTNMQRELTRICIAKAELCLCISHMLRTQYSVLIRDPLKPENTTSSTMMLFPNKDLDNARAVETVDQELKAWAESLPATCQYRPINQSEIQNGRSTLAVQRTLLHMAYQTTISALHRPQFLPASPMQPPSTSRQVQEESRSKVRNAAMQITRMANDLHQYRLDRFLPTTGVTVILPAMIIHLLEMKNPSEESRQRATHGFRRCMRVMERLREMYSAADYATAFLDAALRKAAIDIHGHGGSGVGAVKNGATPFTHTPPPEPSAISGSDPMLSKPQGIASLSMPPNTVNAAALDLSTSSPPQTEFDSSSLTPSASGGSDQTPMGTDLMDVDFLQAQDEFDWDAVGGADFDVDQFLQYPAEGVTNVEEDLMAGVLANATQKDDGEAKTVSWAAELGGDNMDTTMEVSTTA